MSLAWFFATLPAAIANDVTAKKPTLPSDEIIYAANAPQLSSIRIESVTEIPAPASEPLNGKITFDENYTARVSTPVAGHAISIHAQIGDLVKAGQVLAVIDAPELGSAMADASKAESDYELKKKAHERNKMLLEAGVIARKDADSSEADLAQSNAELQRAKARLNYLGSKRINAAQESYAIKSPINGYVVDRQINPGSEVRPDAPAPIFTLTNPDHLWASIDLPERDLAKVYQGQKIQVRVDAYPDEVFDGTVTSIGVVVDPTTRRIPVRCSLQSKGKLKPEMYAQITPLSKTQDKVIQISNHALITEGLYSYVFVEISPGHFKKRRVTLNTQAQTFATVKDGLKAGDHVVTSGALLLNSELSADK